MIGEAARCEHHTPARYHAASTHPPSGPTGGTRASSHTQTWTWDARRVTDRRPAMQRQHQRLTTTHATRTPRHGTGTPTSDSTEVGTRTSSTAPTTNTPTTGGPLCAWDGMREARRPLYWTCRHLRLGYPAWREPCVWAPSRRAGNLHSRHSHQDRRAGTWGGHNNRVTDRATTNRDTTDQELHQPTGTPPTKHHHQSTTHCGLHFGHHRHVPALLRWGW